MPKPKKPVSHDYSLEEAIEALHVCRLKDEQLENGLYKKGIFSLFDPKGGIADYTETTASYSYTAAKGKEYKFPKVNLLEYFILTHHNYPFSTSDNTELSDVNIECGYWYLLIFSGLKITHPEIQKIADNNFGKELPRGEISYENFVSPKEDDPSTILYSSHSIAMGHDSSLSIPPGYAINLF